jgi:hypothetical protein
MAHDLIFYEGRNTPEVVSKGAQGKKGGSGTKAGKVTKRRAASAAEEKKIASGGWLRVDKKGRTPGGKDGYGTGSKVRPKFNKNYSGTKKSSAKKK